MPGDSSVAYANYGCRRATAFMTRRGHCRIACANDEEITKVKVTIASDGTVISRAHHHAVRRRARWMLRCSERWIASPSSPPFPAGLKRRNSIYTINFNPQSQTNARMKYNRFNFLKLFLSICSGACFATNFCRGQDSNVIQIHNGVRCPWQHQAHSRFARRLQRRGCGSFEI